jgi:hypothetical protein
MIGSGMPNNHNNAPFPKPIGSRARGLNATCILWSGGQLRHNNQRSAPRTAGEPIPAVWQRWWTEAVRLPLQLGPVLYVTLRRGIGERYRPVCAVVGRPTRPLQHVRVSPAMRKLFALGLSPPMKRAPSRSKNSGR